MFSQNNFTSLCVKSETFAQVQLAITCLYTLFTNFMTWYQLKTYSEDNPLKRRSIDVMWSCDFSWKYFLLRNFLLEMTTFKQVVKLTFGCKEFGKRTVQNL